jgi:predicted HD superfamily hydrolase involved in NAD metabolism
LNFVELARTVREVLGQRHRYEHVVRVARLSAKLARRHREDPARARLAGMLHDLARLHSSERLLAECERREMTIDPFERAHPVVLHARLSAELARENFGVTDEAVLSAIRKHTLADPLMSRLDEIVYLADTFEPGRDFAGRAELEALAFEDLGAAMLATLRSSVEHLREQGKAVAPITLAALAVYSNNADSGTHAQERRTA